MGTGWRRGGDGVGDGVWDRVGDGVGGGVGCGAWDGLIYLIHAYIVYDKISLSLSLSLYIYVYHHILSDIVLYYLVCCYIFL